MKQYGMKRTAAIGTIMAMALSMAACGARTDTPSSTPTPTIASGTPSPTPTPDVPTPTPTEMQTETPTPAPLPDMAATDVVNGLRYLLADGKLYSLLPTFDVYSYEWTTEMFVRDGVDAAPMAVAQMRNYANQLFWLDDGAMLAAGEWDTPSYRIDPATGAVTACFTGVVRYVDYARGVLYYSVTNEESEKGLYEITLDNLTGTGIFVSEGKFEAFDEAENCLYLSRATTAEDYAQLALYRFDLATRAETLLAVLERTEEDFGYATDMIPVMRVGNDKLVFSLGTYQGTGNFFYGDIVSMDKESGNLVRIQVGEVGDMQPEFEMIHETLYVAGAHDVEYGIHRVSMDLQEWEMVLPSASILGSYSGTLVYETNAEQGTGVYDIMLYDTAANASTMFLSGYALPTFENFSHIRYSNVQRIGDYILYSADVVAYDPEEDGWRGHTAYTVTNLADMDGATVVTLFEEFYDEPVSIGG